MNEHTPAITSDGQAIYDKFVKGLEGGPCFEAGSIYKWVCQQYKTIDLPDERLKKRAHQVVAALAEKPQDSINQANDNWARIKAAYRFIENERVTPEELQAPVNDATALLCDSLDTIIAIQDTTTLSFDSARTAKGLGAINDSKQAKGMFYHPVLAMEENGLPIGLLDQQHWCRESKVSHKAKDRNKREIMDKESGKWIKGITGAHFALKTNVPPGRRPKIIHVFDREGDVHEVFQLIDQLQDGAVIRSTQNRRVLTADGRSGLSHELVRSAPLLGETTIDVPRKPGEKKRKATLELRAETLTLNPNNNKHSGRLPVSLTLLEAWEANPPDNAKSVHWLLWTTEPVKDLHDAARIMHIYTLRWKIEEFFFVLKQGCKIEKLQLETADRLAKAVSLYAPIALRILKCRDLARLDPDAPCTNILSDDEWRVLWLKINKTFPPPDQKAPTIKQAVLWIARLGGHIGRKSDGMPGSKTLWLGFRDLAIMVDIYRLFKN